MVPGMATHDYNPNTWKAEMGIVNLRPAWALFQKEWRLEGGRKQKRKPKMIH